MDGIRAIQMTDGFLKLQRVGVALILVGVGIFVYAWWVERRARRAGGRVGASETTTG